MGRVTGMMHIYGRSRHCKGNSNSQSGVGFALTPVFWLGNNEKALKDSLQSLDEKIKRLQKY